jgi:aldehyde dehydrogenase (NAD+)
MTILLEDTTGTGYDATAPTVNWATAWLSERKELFIGGTWRKPAGEEYSSSTNPATGKLLGHFAEASKIDVDSAVSAARSAFSSESWRTMSRRKRAELLRQIATVVRRHHAELATLECLDNGKLYREAFNDDIPEVWEVFEYYAGWIDKYYSENCPVDAGFLNYTKREPLGVCGLIVPWNFPLLLAAWKIAPALAMGNSVVVKPSPFTPFSILRFMEIVQNEVDLPAGVINLVTGGAETGKLLTEHPDVDKISFTGSTATGKRVVHGSADSNLKTISLELGGKSPNIVFEDAPDLAFAIQRSFDAMFSHKGEKCSEPTRFFLHKSIYDQFLAELSSRAEATICGDPFDSRSTQGAQCNEQQLNKILYYIEKGKKDRLKLVAGGHRDVSGDNEQGFFVRPTIFADVDNRLPIAQEEIFGPVLVVTPFSDEDEVVKMANETTYGLAAGVWTANLSRAHRMADKLDAGMIFINKYGCYDFASPFGGFKQSGWGKEMAVHSLDSYTRLKSVWLKID